MPTVATDQQEALVNDLERAAGTRAFGFSSFVNDFDFNEENILSLAPSPNAQTCIFFFLLGYYN